MFNDDWSNITGFRHVHQPLTGVIKNGSGGTIFEAVTLRFSPKPVVPSSGVFKVISPDGQIYNAIGEQRRHRHGHMETVYKWAEIYLMKMLNENY